MKIVNWPQIYHLNIKEYYKDHIKNKGKIIVYLFFDEKTS